MGTLVHPTAVVDDPAAIGEGTRIWHFAHVMAGARVGKGCTLGQNVFVAAGAVIGDGVKLQNNVSVFDGVVLEDWVFCGPSCTFTNVALPRAEISRRGEYLTTRVRRGATIGANATIVCGATIGRYAFVGAGAVVARGEVADYALVAGVPARPRGWVSRHGHVLPAAGADGLRVCPGSGLRYREATGGLACVDWDEERPLGLSAPA